MGNDEGSSEHQTSPSDNVTREGQGKESVTENPRCETPNAQQYGVSYKFNAPVLHFTLLARHTSLAEGVQFHRATLPKVYGIQRPFHDGTAALLNHQFCKAFFTLTKTVLLQRHQQ